MVRKAHARMGITDATVATIIALFSLSIWRPYSYVNCSDTSISAFFAASFLSVSPEMTVLPRNL